MSILFSEKTFQVDPFRLGSLLYFGYEPTPPDGRGIEMLWRVSSIMQDTELHQKRMNFKNAKERAKTLFKKIIEEMVSTSSYKRHCVRLSGGLDSRLILGELLEVLERREICALSVGHPDADDCAIARKICRRYGVEHQIYEVDRDEWSTGELVECAQAMGAPAPFVCGQRFMHYKALKMFGRDQTYWDGFLGGYLGGNFGMGSVQCSWKSAVADFVHRSGPVVPMDLIPFKPSFGALFPERSWLTGSRIPIFDQLYIPTRQCKHIWPGRVCAGYQIKTPFWSDEWIAFWLQLDRKWKESGLFYWDFLRTSYPQLFRTESTTRLAHCSQKKNAGRLAKLLSAYRMKKYRVNKTATNEAAHRSPSFIRVATENLHDLKNRGLFDEKDMPEIGSVDSFKAIASLVSLEINLKACDLRRSESQSTV